MAQGQTAPITFRPDPSMNDKIEEMVEDLHRKGIPASRGMVACTLLARALGDDDNAIIAAEVMRRTYRVIESATQRTIADVVAQIPGYVDEAQQGV
jgi:hypothetical protein